MAGKPPFMPPDYWASLIALLWYWYATDFPRQHPHVNEAEAAIIEGKDLEKINPSPRNGGEGQG